MPWQPGDAIVLIEPLAFTCAPAALEELLAMLRLRQFLRSEPFMIDGDVRTALEQICSESRCGCRVRVEQAEANGALVTCARHAHLALTLVVERGRQFSAECIGVVTAAGIDLRTGSAE